MDRKISNLIFNQKQVNKGIWFMRQAGRYLPEYRAIRKEKNSFWDMCFDSDTVTEITLQPIKRFNLDAAIIFSDILIIPYLMNIDIQFIKGQGLIIKDIEENINIQTESLDKKLQPVYDALKNVRKKLPSEKSLIGFTGCPWTITTYCFNDYHSHKSFHKTKKIIKENKNLFENIMQSLEKHIISHLEKQIENGCDTIMLFESNSYPNNEYNVWKHIIEPTKRIVKKIKENHPDIAIIGFPRGIGHHLKDYIKHTGIDAISLDYTVPIKTIQELANEDIIIQGNLDPALLAYNLEDAKKYTYRLLEIMDSKSFIFNLGHGILPDTPIEHVETITDIVRKQFSYSQS